METRRSLLLNVFPLGMALLLAISLILGVLLPASSKGMGASYTVCDDSDYYSETTYYFNEYDYIKSLDKGDSKYQVRATVANITQTETSEQSDDEFVLAARKNVWVYESEDKDGIVTESRLLKKDEIDKLQNEGNGILLASSSTPDSGGGDDGNLSSGSTVITPPPPDPNEFVGRDSQNFTKLSINFNVYYNTESCIYKVNGYASWEAKLVWGWDGNKSAEEGRVDFLSFTWGGDGNLEAIAYGMSGHYYDGGTMDCGQNQVDRKAGIIWQFYEKSGWMGKEMEYAHAYVNLERPSVAIGKKTTIYMNYVHTYGSFDGKVTIGTGGASLEISNTKDSWELQLECPNITY